MDFFRWLEETLLQPGRRSAVPPTAIVVNDFIKLRLEVILLFFIVYLLCSDNQIHLYYIPSLYFFISIFNIFHLAPVLLIVGLTSH